MIVGYTTDFLRGVIALFMIVSGAAIVADKTRRSYDPIGYGLIAYGIDFLFWSLYYKPIDFPGIVRLTRGIYLGSATLLWIAIGIQQWSLTRKYRKSAKERKAKRNNSRSKALEQEILGTDDDSSTEIPSLDNDD